MRSIKFGSRVTLKASCDLPCWGAHGPRHSLIRRPCKSILSMWKAGRQRCSLLRTHQSLLIDTGWPGFEGRDADRIVAAAKTGRYQQN